MTRKSTKTEKSDTFKKKKRKNQPSEDPSDLGDSSDSEKESKSKTKDNNIKICKLIQEKYLKENSHHPLILTQRSIVQECLYNKHR